MCNYLWWLISKCFRHNSSHVTVGICLFLFLFLREGLRLADLLLASASTFTHLQLIQGNQPAQHKRGAHSSAGCQFVVGLPVITCWFLEKKNPKNKQTRFWIFVCSSFVVFACLAVSLLVLVHHYFHLCPAPPSLGFQALSSVLQAPVVPSLVLLLYICLQHWTR